MFRAIFKKLFPLLLEKWLQVALLTLFVATGLVAGYARGEAYAEWSEV